MSKNDQKQDSGTKALRPRARIMRTLGDELISSEVVALIELVKNAYDADARRVLVKFEGDLSIGQGKIEVIDNGHGMSLDTILNHWFEPATMVKKHQRKSEKLKRRVLGEKGIGRFAVSRLADRLEVVTRRAGTDAEVLVLFDWLEFDKEDKYLDEIEILWEVGRPAEICPDGTIKELWEEDDKPPRAVEMSHGTILRMEGLRIQWERDQIETIRRDLSRLISPAFGQDAKLIKEDFQIRLKLPSPYEEFSGVIGPPDALKNPHYTLKGDVAADGSYDVTVEYRGNKPSEGIQGKAVFADGHKPLCGPFSIELRVWDRDTPSLAELAQGMRSTVADLRRDLDRATGINIYRDGFRVLPYGEPNNDWLRLDIRRVNNPGLRLSNNQVAGYVYITADKNPLLRDQSNREGLIGGLALDDFRELIRHVLSELEIRRYNARHQNDGKETPPRRGGLFTDFSLQDVSEVIKTRHPQDTALITMVEEKAKALDHQVQEVQQVLTRYRSLATLGQLIDTVLHDGRAPLSKIGNEAALGKRDLERIDKNNGKEDLLLKLGKRFNSISSQSEVLDASFRRIEPFGGRKRGRPVTAQLEQMISNAFSVLQSKIDDLRVKVDLPKTDTQVTLDPVEIQEVIVNLLENSLYWLRQVPEDSRAISVSVKRRGSDEVEILFSDSGPGVNSDFRDLIFDPYFSTKPDGIGLGLTIVGEIISEYYDGDLDLIDKGPLAGATFRIILRRRV
jgi:signal transduction histidine kinase